MSPRRCRGVGNPVCLLVVVVVLLLLLLLHPVVLFGPVTSSGGPRQFSRYAHPTHKRAVVTPPVAAPAILSYIPSILSSHPRRRDTVQHDMTRHYMTRPASAPAVQIGDRSSEFYPNVNEIRREGSFVYESFVETQGTDVKVGGAVQCNA